VSTFKSLGAAPTPINLNEAYSALQTKLVDGVTDPLVIFESEKILRSAEIRFVDASDVGRILVRRQHHHVDKSSKQLQETFARLSSDAARKQRADVARLEDEVASRLVARGMVVNRPKPEAFIRKLRDSGFYSHWRETFGENGWRALENMPDRLGELRRSKRASRSHPLSTTLAGLDRMGYRVHAWAGSRRHRRRPALRRAGDSRRRRRSSLRPRHPLVWSDELAQALFLWLGMIGAAMAVRRSTCD
jgi:hypothetical protein